MIKVYSFLLYLLLISLAVSAQNILRSDFGMYCNVKVFGAKGDGKQLDHRAINRAIEYCAAKGGGTVFLPSGTYLCGSIHLKSNINLYLDAGAIIKGVPPESKAYDEAEPFPDTAYQGKYVCPPNDHHLPDTYLFRGKAFCKSFYADSSLLYRFAQAYRCLFSGTGGDRES
jgi:polygalacturonase